MRLPKVGEYTKCGICFNVCSMIDAEWVDWFLGLPSYNQDTLYNKDEDCFLSYDGCESI